MASELAIPTRTLAFNQRINNVKYTFSPAYGRSDALRARIDYVLVHYILERNIFNLSNMITTAHDQDVGVAYIDLF